MINWKSIAQTRPYIDQVASRAFGELPEVIRDGFASAKKEEQVARLARTRPLIDTLLLQDDASRAWQQACTHLILSSEEHRWKDLLAIAMNTDPSPNTNPVFTEKLQS